MHQVKHLSSCVSCCDAINQTKLSESQKLKQKQHFNQQLLSTNFKCSNVQTENDVRCIVGLD